jgi:hypothetical protein
MMINLLQIHHHMDLFINNDVDLLVSNENGEIVAHNESPQQQLIIIIPTDQSMKHNNATPQVISHTLHLIIIPATHDDYRERERDR